MSDEINPLIYVGVAISVGGNILISIALNVQKYSHNQNEKAEVKISYLKRPMWWAGFILVLTGESLLLFFLLFFFLGKH